MCTHTYKNVHQHFILSFEFYVFIASKVKCILSCTYTVLLHFEQLVRQECWIQPYIYLGHLLIQYVEVPEVPKHPISFSAVSQRSQLHINGSLRAVPWGSWSRSPWSLWSCCSAGPASWSQLGSPWGSLSDLVRDMRIGYILWPMSLFHRKKWGIFYSRANRR